MGSAASLHPWSASPPGCLGRIDDPPPDHVYVNHIFTANRAATGDLFVLVARRRRLGKRYPWDSVSRPNLFFWSFARRGFWSSMPVINFRRSVDAAEEKVAATARL